MLDMYWQNYQNLLSITEYSLKFEKGKTWNFFYEKVSFSILQKLANFH